MMDLKEWKEEQLGRLKADMNRMVRDFFRDFGTSMFEEVRGQVPLVDISEKGEAIIITLELPGVDANDLDISVSPDTLRIAGNMRESSSGAGNRIERSRSFSHRLKLRCHVDPARVEATYKDNLLTISLPKCGSMEYRKIPVRQVKK